MAKETKKKNQIDMLHGPMLKKIIMVALPIAATSVLQQLFNTVDTAVVGKFAGSEALAAVGSTGPLISLLINLFVGLSVGANVVIANYIGQGREDKVNGAVRTAMSIAALCGFIMIFVGIFAAKPLLTLMGTPDEVIDLAVLYMRIFFIGMPFSMVYNFGASILRSKGDTKRPLYCLFTSGIVNVGLNLLLVIVFKMSVDGVAIATVTANLLNCVLVLYFLAHEEPSFRFTLKDIRFEKEYLTRILMIGVPSGIQGMVFSISNVCVQSAINTFGPDTVAGSSAALTFEVMAFFIANAFVQTTVTFVSQNYGAGNMKRCTKVLVRCLVLAVACSFLFDYIVWFGKGFFIGLFTDSMYVVPPAYARFRYVLLFQPMVAVYEVTGAYIRGTGRSIVPAVVSLFGTCLLRIIWAFVVVREGFGYPALLHTYPASWIVTIILMGAAYFIVRKKDMKKV